MLCVGLDMEANWIARRHSVDHWSVTSTVFSMNTYMFSSIVNTVLVAVLKIVPATCISSCQTVNRDVLLNIVPAACMASLEIANHRSFASTVLSVLSTMLGIVLSRVIVPTTCIASHHIVSQFVVSHRGIASTCIERDHTIEGART